MASFNKTLCLDDVFDHIEQEEELNCSRIREARILNNENFYHGVDLSEFDPYKSLNDADGSKNKIDSLSLSFNKASLSDDRKCQNGSLVLPKTKTVAPVTKIAIGNNLSKIDKFLEAAEIYFLENSINISIKYGLSEDQKLIKIFYDLFMCCDVYTIEILYLCAKSMQIVLHDSIYEFLKVCRFSYDASLKLYDDIGNFTKFHPYFYEHVIKSTLNILFDNSGEFMPENYSILIKIFMAARYHNILLSADILRQMLEKLSVSPRTDAIGVVLDYSLKIGITATILRQSLTYFSKNSKIFKDIINILKDNFKNSTTKILNDPVIWNELLILIDQTENHALTLDIFEFILINEFPVSLEALDVVFSAPTTSDQREILLKKSLQLIDLSVYVPLGVGSFAQALWLSFQNYIESNQPISSLPLLPYLVRVDKKLASKNILSKFYDQMRLYDLDESMFCRIRGFIQHFELF